MRLLLILLVALAVLDVVVVYAAIVLGARCDRDTARAFDRRHGLRVIPGGAR